MPGPDSPGPLCTSGGTPAVVDLVQNRMAAFIVGNLSREERYRRTFPLPAPDSELRQLEGWGI